MAVEIPVIVDIEKAFKEAAKRATVAMQPLQRTLSKEALELKFKIGTGEEGPIFRRFSTVVKNFKAGKDVATELRMAVKAFDAELQKAVMTGNKADFSKFLEAKIYAQDALIALSRVRKEITGLSSTIIGLNARISSAQSAINSYRIDSPEWKKAVKEMQSISAELDKVKLKMEELGTKSGSIDRITLRTKELNRQWNALSKTQKFDSDGNLSKSAQKMRANYKKLIEEARKYGMSLQQIIDAEKTRTEVLRKASQQRRRDNAVLNMTTKSMRILQEQERILSAQLSKATFGSEKYSKLKERLQGVRQEISKISDDINGKVAPAVNRTNAAISRQSGLLRSLTSYASMYISVFALLRFAKQIRDVTAELEYQRVALGYLIKDVEYGAVLFERIKAAAKESPFRINDLTTYTKQLAAYQIETENLFGTMMKLADISAGLGVSMDRLILAYGQVRAASVLRGQELRQFTEAGIPLVDKLAEKFTILRGETVKTADVFQLISERAVPFSMIAEIFDDMTESGGMFYKMQDRQADTLRGRWEKLKDAFDIGLQTIGESKGLLNANTYMNLLLKTLNLLANNLNLIPKLLEGVTAAMIAFKVASIGTKKAIDAETLSQARLSSITAAQGRTFVLGARQHVIYRLAVMKTNLATNALTRSFWKLTAAMAANPIGAVAALVIGLTTAIVSFRKRTDETTDATEEYTKSIEALSKAESDFTKNDKLIKRFEKLSGLVEKTAAQERELINVQRRLGQSFPELAQDIKSGEAGFDEIIKKLKDANEEAKATAEKTAKIKLLALRDELTAAYKDLEEADKAAAEAEMRYNAQRTMLENVTSNEKFKGRDKDSYIEEHSRQERVAFTEASAAAAKAAENVNTLEQRIKSYEKYLGMAADNTAEWMKDLMQFSTYDVEGIDRQLFSEENLQEYGTLFKTMSELKKDYKESWETYKAIGAAAEDASGEAFERLMKDRDAELARFEALEKIRIHLGQNWQKEDSASDSRLSDMKKRIDDLTNAYRKFLEVSQYKGEKGALVDIAAFFPQLKGFKPTYQNTVDRLRSMLADVRRQVAASPDDTVLIDMQRELEKALSNLQTDDLVKALSDTMKRVKDEIRRSDVARKFFDDMLELTGDQDVATSLTVSVYGDIGEEFKKNMQKQLSAIFDFIPSENISDDLRKAFSEGDVRYIVDHIAEIPEEQRKAIQEVASDTEAYNAEWLRSIMNRYKKEKDFEQRISDVRRIEADKRRQIDENESLLPSEKEDLKTASIRKENEDIAAIEYERLKNQYEWTKTFEDANNVSIGTLTRLKTLLEDIKNKYAEYLTPAALKAITNAIEKTEAQITKFDPFKGVASSIRDYIDARRKVTELKSKGKGDSKEFKEAQDAEQKSLSNLSDSLNAIASAYKSMDSIISQVEGLFDVDELSDEAAVIKSIHEGLNMAATALTAVAAGIILVKTAAPEFLAIAAAIGAIVAASKAISNIRVARANRELERQERILNDLEYAYERLQKAEEKVFGAEYIENYNQRLANLQAQIEAYNKQAAAEREKGKKEDEERTREYEKSARQAADEILDMQREVAARMLGSEQADAARDFASAWIDAYKEFGSTTDAIKEKFKDMVQNMIVESMAAKVVENLLSPIYDQIGQLTKDGELGADDAAIIAQMMSESVGTMDSSLTNLMNILSAAGLNFRSFGGSLTGISKDIAGASEESILGLAAGINTQNFYISGIYNSVNNILSYMTGEVTTTNIQQQRLDPDLLMASMNSIQRDISDVRTMLRSIISPKSANASTHYISVR